MRKYHYFRNAFLGTSLTALFLLVRCAVPERDYSLLGIGGNAGGVGESGSGGRDGSGGTSADQGGQGGSLDGGLSGQGGGGGTPVEPVPCDATNPDAGSSDAGSSDAGSSDAGSSDAGSNDAACACVDGFIQAVDGDGDGEGTRECSVAPGRDCDDGDRSVTHNGCGGCSALPNALGADCLDCGAYICDGPDAVICASKPDPVVVDPDCRCVAALIVARDTDGDREGTRLCEQNPGIDCNDGNGAFVTNACGGCDSLPGTVGADCNQCGAYACSGTSLVCAPKAGSAGRRCVDGNTRQSCVGTGFWDVAVDCANVCYQGNCETCTPGVYQCVALGGGSYQLERCVTDASLGSSSYGVGWTSWDSCTPTQTCNATIGQCTGYLMLPRDRIFDVAPLQRGGLPWHDVLNTASDADYG